MNRLQQHPLLIFVALLVLAALACNAVNTRTTAVSNPAATVDTDTIVNRVVATVSAQPALPISSSPLLNVEGSAADLELALVDLYLRVNPSVVHVFTRRGNLPLGEGSGFIIDVDGHIVTNNHVVESGTDYEIVFANGERRRAQLVGTDVDSDLAVVRAESLPVGALPVALGDSQSLQVGQLVIAIGNPFGEEGSMSLGIISGLGRSLTSQRVAEGGGRYSLPEVIQTDTAINPGNSGGPLLNLRGEVIGVNSAIRTTTGTNSGVGFAIPVNAVRRVAPALIVDGRYIYPFIGIGAFPEPLSLPVVEQFELPQTTGAYVTAVTIGSPAATAGLIPADQTTGKGGDLIIAIDGREVKEFTDLTGYLVFETEVGQEIELTILRNGRQIVVPLTLGARP